MASAAAPVVPVTDDAAVSAVTDGVAAVTVAADASGEASATSGAGTGAGAGAGAGAASGAASDATTGAATGADADIGADLFQAAHRVLTEPDTDAKAKLTLRAWEMFLDESLPVLVEGGAAAVPEPVTVPGRPSTVEEVPPNQMKGNRTSRKALVHSLVHAESYAIDLAWDVVLRFGRPGEDGTLPYPKDFYHDFARVAFDEAVHYSRWKARLEALDAHYGCMSAHPGLWDAASATSGSLEERLVLVNCIHEARGLDVASIARRKFTRAQDEESVAILNMNVKDEMTHVAAGVKWLIHTCGGEDAARVKFQELARTLFKGKLKGPFDVEGRAAAGLHESWYMPLTESPPASPTVA